MTSEQQTNEVPGEPYALIEAFIDGEPVAPEALKHALADPHARDYLADLLVLRGEVARMTPTSHADVDRGFGSWRLGWLAAAAAVIISLTAGFLAGQRFVTPVAAQGVEAVAQVPPAVSAPRPTRVIKLEIGSNWTESSGRR